MMIDENQYPPDRNGVATGPLSFESGFSGGVRYTLHNKAVP